MISLVSFRGLISSSLLLWVFFVLTPIPLFSAEEKTTPLPNSKNQSATCSNCQNKFEILSETQLENCPLCGSSNLKIEAAVSQKGGKLNLQLTYWGGDQKSIPDYALIYINKRFLGRMEKGENGHYNSSFENITPGVYDFRVRMRFFKHWGLQPDYKWKKFQDIGIREGEVTTLQYRWENNRRFGEKEKTDDTKREHKTFNPQLEKWNQ